MSSQSQGVEVDLSAVNRPTSEDGGVAHGARLLAFVDAVMGDDDAALDHARGALREVLSDEPYVDACAVIGAFNVVDRIADATGIPLDPSLVAIGGGLRHELDLGRFASAANTPG